MRKSSVEYAQNNVHVRQELAVHQNTTAGTSEDTSMKPYQINGYDEEVVLSMRRKMCT
jgi:hypothetical protein